MASKLHKTGGLQERDFPEKPKPTLTLPLLKISISRLSYIPPSCLLHFQSFLFYIFKPFPNIS